MTQDPKAYATGLLQEILDEMPPSFYNPTKASQWMRERGWNDGDDVTIEDLEENLEDFFATIREEDRQLILNKAKREGLVVKKK